MMHAARIALVTAVVLGTSCARTLPPTPQIVLYIDTDAIVGRATLDPLALGRQVDQVRFDLAVGSVPVPNGTSVFPLDEDRFRAHRVSFGITPEDGALTSVRVRLYRADRVLGAELPAGVVIDQTIDVPAPTDGVVEVNAFLAAATFGIPGHVTAQPGRPGPSRVGSWRGGRRIGCAAPPGPNEACVPGGSFFLGDPAFRGRTFANDIVDERLVWISPFYLDTHETTVGELRAAKLGSTPAPLPRTEGLTDEDAGYCTYSRNPGAREGLPVTCVTWATARAYCQGRAKDLPTEAQFELVASGLGDELSYPWGNDDTDCAGSVWGRGGVGLYVDGSAACRAGVPSQPAPGGSTTRDSVDLTGRGGAGAPIVDLGGNVSEWTLDDWSAPDGFWKPVAPMFDPVATSAPGAARLKAARGAGFPFTLLETRAAFRLQRAPDDVSAEIGFRCARHADPAGAP